MINANSFDVFDTLIARKCKYPHDIFEIIELNFPYPNFKKYRMKAEEHSYNILNINNNIDHIYSSFAIITKESIDLIEKLKEYEIQTEYEYSIPIISNINKIKENDIYVSDMYLKSEQIYKLLSKHDININNKLFVTNGGKHDGSVYEKLLKTYNINLHTGDNLHSDVLMANKFGIMAFYTKISNFTSTENLLYDLKFIKLQQCIREFRLKNPYPENSFEYKLFHEQITYNIPILILFSFQLKSILDKENRTKILFITRDCCLLQKIFNKLFPSVNTIRFASSRIINKKSTPDYIEYIKNNYNDENSLIVDLHGSFRSGRILFEQIFGFYPRVHLLVWDNASLIYDKLTFSINKDDFIKNHNIYYLDYIESMNYDLIGSLFSFVDSNELRIYNENDEKNIEVIHNCVDDFLNFYSFTNDIIDIELLENKYDELIRQILINLLLRDNNNLSILHDHPTLLTKKLIEIIDL